MLFNMARLSYIYTFSFLVIKSEHPSINITYPYIYNTEDKQKVNKGQTIHDRQLSTMLINLGL